MDAKNSGLARQLYVILCPWPVKAGTGVNNAILGIAGAMSERYEPRIAVTGWSSPAPGQTWLKLRAPQKSIKSKLGTLAHLLPDMLRLRRLTRGAAAVNAHFFGLEILPLALLRLFRLAPPLILSVHGSDVAEVERSTGWMRAIQAWIYAQGDVCIACSNALAAKVKRISPSANVVTVWNGVSSPPAVPGERPLAAPYLICVANFVPVKAHAVLLEAFRRVAEIRPDLHLVLLGGDGPERAPVRQRIAELGLEDRAHMHVNVPHEQVWNWVRHAECFILASRNEAFGIAVLEAGLLRTPVVATCVGGIPEFLTDGEHGLLCEPDNPDQLTAAILETLGYPEKARLRADVFHSRAVQFTWDRSFEKYMEFAGLR